jgi:hypothetical protein
MDVRLVRQEDKYGCAVASLAMVTGKSYAEVRAAFSHDFTKEGVVFFAWEEYLTHSGYAVARKMQYDALKKSTREPWPAEPFAGVHICEVLTDAGGHVVVMLRDGTVLDPATDEPRRLADYKSVNFVTGVYKVDG